MRLPERVLNKNRAFCFNKLLIIIVLIDGIMPDRTRFGHMGFDNG